MTEAKERLMTMVPEMPTMIPKLTEDKVQQVLNIFVTVQEDNSYDVSNRIGAGEGQFDTPADFDATNDEIYAMLMESASKL